MAMNASNSIALAGSIPGGDRLRKQLALVEVVLGGSCPGDSCPGWPLSWVAIVLGGSWPGGYCAVAVVQVTVVREPFEILVYTFIMFKNWPTSSHPKLRTGNNNHIRLVLKNVLAVIFYFWHLIANCSFELGCNLNFMQRKLRTIMGRKLFTANQRY